MRELSEQPSNDPVVLELVTNGAAIRILDRSRRGAQRCEMVPSPPASAFTESSRRLHPDPCAHFDGIAAGAHEGRIRSPEDLLPA
jgi:hypothetical protein